MVTADADMSFEQISVEAMAFDLNDAMVDLDVIEICASELLHRRHPTKLVARLVDRAIDTARQQRSAWT